MTLQKVLLLGPVARVSAAVSDQWGGGRVFVVATRRDDSPDVVVDHHHVRDTHTAEMLALGTEVFVEGQVVLDRESRRHIVLARSVMTLSLPADLDHPIPGGTTHRSPTPHVRNGHWRRVRSGRPDERLVWVRETHVGRDGWNRFPGRKGLSFTVLSHDQPSALPDYRLARGWSPHHA